MRLYHVTFCALVWVCCYSKKQNKVNATPEKCEKWAGRFDRCLSKGFEPRHFVSCDVEAYSTDLTEKEQIRCRRVERRLKNKCFFTCPPVMRLGAPYEVDVTDPDVVSAADVIVNQFRDRAIQNQALGDTQTIVRGDIVKAMTQVVSGKRFILTLELGVTDAEECHERAAVERIVSANQCPHGLKLGLYKVSLIHAPWVTPQYTFEQFEDLEGEGLRNKYWETQELQEEEEEEVEEVVDVEEEVVDVEEEVVDVEELDELNVEEDEEENMDDFDDFVLGGGGGMLGAPYEVDVTDPDVVSAADVIVNQLRDRAIQNQALGDRDVIVKGRIIRAFQQVVSGLRYTITLEVGVTDSAECRDAAQERVVSNSNCVIDNFGIYEITMISAPWRDPAYTFEKFEEIKAMDGQKFNLWD